MRRFFPVGLLLLLLLFYLFLNISGCGSDEPSAKSEENFAPYPTIEWTEAAPEDVGMDRLRLEELEQYFEQFAPTSLIVVHRGYLVWEKYWRGHTRETRFESFSVTKSFTSAMAGIAIEEGLFGLDQPAADFIDSWKPPDPRSAIIIRDLLTMTSGLYWYWSEYLHIGLSHLFGPCSEDLMRYSLSLPLAYAPGSRWTYNNCALMALSYIFSTMTGMELKYYARERLFEPIGMHSVNWLTDGKGHTYPFMGLDATARDLARFGYLSSRGGRWESGQLLPTDWVALTTKPYSDLNPAYGYLWWVNGYSAHWEPMEGQPPFHIPQTGHFFGEDTPQSSYAALGAFGQMIAVVPELNLVMVRTGGSECYDFKRVFTLLCKTAIQ